jgi:hypothetical protein
LQILWEIPWRIYWGCLGDPLGDPEGDPVGDPPSMIPWRIGRGGPRGSHGESPRGFPGTTKGLHRPLLDPYHTPARLPLLLLDRARPIPDSQTLITPLGPYQGLNPDPHCSFRIMRDRYQTSTRPGPLFQVAGSGSRVWWGSGRVGSGSDRSDLVQSGPQIGTVHPAVLSREPPGICKKEKKLMIFQSMSCLEVQRPTFLILQTARLTKSLRFTKVVTYPRQSPSQHGV